MAGKPEGYVEVNERIQRFYERYPEGSLQSYLPPYVTEAGNKQFVVYAAAAYRTPDDPRPGIGWAWEPVPGPTSFTKDSELMNAETSAWGRAIAALGFEVKNGIASANEVRSAQAKNGSAQGGTGGGQPASRPAAPSSGTATQAQTKRLAELTKTLIAAEKITSAQVAQAAGLDPALVLGAAAFRGLREPKAAELIERLERYAKAEKS